MLLGAVGALVGGERGMHRGAQGRNLGALWGRFPSLQWRERSRPETGLVTRIPQHGSPPLRGQILRMTRLERLGKIIFRVSQMSTCT